jgi:alpha-beta hydrolase superfamily lysophospholipase
MKHITFGWRTADNTPIFAQGWQPADAPVGVVCLLHGLGDHSSRYAHVARTLGDARLATLTFDHYGHGQSGGKRGHAPGYDSFLKNIERLLAEARRRFADRPVFLYGHSMGGNLALTYALRRRPPLAGVIASSPWLRLAQPPPRAQVAAARLASRIAPAFALRTNLNPDHISRDPAAVTAYATDPLNHNRCSVRLFTACHYAGQWALAHAEEFTLPLLIFHGSADRITCPHASREFAAAVPAGCTFKVWDNLYHETHNEPEQVAVLQTVIDWLAAQMNDWPGNGGNSVDLAPAVC